MVLLGYASHWAVGKIAKLRGTATEKQINRMKTLLGTDVFKDSRNDIILAEVNDTYYDVFELGKKVYPTEKEIKKFLETFAEIALRNNMASITTTDKDLIRAMNMLVEQTKLVKKSASLVFKKNRNVNDEQVRQLKKVLSDNKNLKDLRNVITNTIATWDHMNGANFNKTLSRLTHPTDAGIKQFLENFDATKIRRAMLLVGADVRLTSAADMLIEQVNVVVGNPVVRTNEKVRSIQDGQVDAFISFLASGDYPSTRNLIIKGWVDNSLVGIAEPGLKASYPAYPSRGEIRTFLETYNNESVSRLLMLAGAEETYVVAATLLEQDVRLALGKQNRLSLVNDLIGKYAYRFLVAVGLKTWFSNSASNAQKGFEGEVSKAGNVINKRSKAKLPAYRTNYIRQTVVAKRRKRAEKRPAAFENVSEEQFDIEEQRKNAEQILKDFGLENEIQKRLIVNRQDNTIELNLNDIEDVDLSEVVKIKGLRKLSLSGSTVKTC